MSFLHIPPRAYDSAFPTEQLSHNKGYHLSTVVGQELNRGSFSPIAGAYLQPYNIRSQVTCCARATVSIALVTSNMETLCAAPRRYCLISSPQCTLPSTNRHVFDTKVHASSLFQLTVSTSDLSFARVKCALAREDNCVSLLTLARSRARYLPPAQTSPCRCARCDE